MGLYISKLGIQALIVSQIAMHGSAFTQNTNSVDTNVLISDIQLNEIKTAMPHMKEGLLKILDSTS
ncbi:hypothetical protein DSO57_1034919 [Entomophthora muscae]|uniref:Uncharacterized protein n=1 Tax=Entomophthora muscae TaxID=34485 RepID=A0ACC2S1M8_9FUNG|nr:hypothetical protein DSO57_1034919 [Entomophthora muscae]